MIYEIISSRPTFALQESQKEERKKGTENLFEEIMAEHFSNLGKETNIQI